MSVKQKILIVDDKPENLYTLESVLKLTNVEIIKSLNGNDALVAILNHEFSLAILDVQMPDMDGYELAEIIRGEEKSHQIPIIFLSAAFSDDIHVFQGYKSGGVDYITKPFNPNILLDKVKIFLDIDHNKKKLEEMLVEIKKSNNELNKEIQKREEVELALKDNEEKLKYLNASKDKFFSIIAHDLRNPFSSLIGISNILISNFKNLNDEEKIEQIKKMEETSRNSHQLLENLLQWSRSQTGRLELYMQVNDIKSIAIRAINLLKSSATQKGLNLNNCIEYSIQLKFDLNMISTVIRNLLSNSIKFTKKNGSVSIIALENDGFVQVTIEDTGVGMDDKTVNKLFRIDEHVTTPGTNNETGSGLGLILCKEFVEKHGGKIWAESEIGIGSRFIFTIPKT